MTYKMLKINTNKLISIHIPYKGYDSSVFRQNSAFYSISIHIPYKGYDAAIACFSVVSFWHFNPHTL